MGPLLYHGGEVKPISTFRQHYEYMKANHLYDNNFTSQTPIGFPVTTNLIDYLIFQYILFYPIYDSYINLSKGKPSRFLQLIDKANTWLLTLDTNEESVGQSISQELLSRAKEAAEQRIKVMPAIRWQVFQRDNWRCVSCGRGSQDDIILHVDHIVPRSKGGKDVLQNYQTLCHICNLGKSNKDDTDLRQNYPYK
jgi:5-methylcytosine-specific restriction endonuclease McrA